MAIVKRFLQWIGLKENLHGAVHKPPFFKEGEIWWCHLGENVGIETNGKGDRFTRPIFVLKKYDRYSFLGLPLTTKKKKGSWYAPISFAGVEQIIVLAQGRVFDYRRLKEKMGELDEHEAMFVKKSYLDLHSISLKNRPPAVSGGSRG